MTDILLRKQKEHWSTVARARDTGVRSFMLDIQNRCVYSQLSYLSSPCFSIMQQYRRNHGNNARHLKSGQTRFFVLSIWFVSTVLLKNSKSPHGFHALLNKYSHEQDHHLTFHTDSHRRHGRDGMFQNPYADNADADADAKRRRVGDDTQVRSFPLSCC